MPALGLTRAALVCVLLSFLSAVATLLAFPALPRSPAASTRTAAPFVLPLLALTGLLGIGYEVLVVRVLSQVTENTVYTFALLLAVYLVGTALGAAAYQRWRGGADLPERRQRLLRLLAAACLLGTASLWGAEELKVGVSSALGPGIVAALAAEGSDSPAARALLTELQHAAPARPEAARALRELDGRLR
ncbi:MAG TPA: hypothetical protein VFR86_01760 [Burkholderiaceae bacterium]|nr:hypothetical protein [Burkholderiaceae bacterium]